MKKLGNCHLCHEATYLYMATEDCPEYSDAEGVQDELYCDSCFSLYMAECHICGEDIDHENENWEQLEGRFEIAHTDCIDTPTHVRTFNLKYSLKNESKGQEKEQEHGM